jgi:hypothetical protein
MKTKQQQAKKALDFLRGHPAFNHDGGDSMFDGMWFHMEECCKHGKSKYCGKTGIDVYDDSKDAQKYKKYFDKEYKDNHDEKFKKVEIPYEVYYGEPWKFDHVEYWYELTFFVFNGDAWDIKEDWKPENWHRFGAPMGGANDFDSMLIKVANVVKKTFGNFSIYDESFETKTEKEYKKNLYKKPLMEILNKDYAHIPTDGMKNLRWLAWFIKTPYCEKNWKEYIPEWQKLIDKSSIIPDAVNKKIIESIYENLGIAILSNEEAAKRRTNPPNIDWPVTGN